MEGIGKTLLALGLIIATIGGALLFFGKIPFLGKLPGDITVQRPGFTLYIPLATSLLISILISLVLWLFRR